MVMQPSFLAPPGRFSRARRRAREEWFERAPDPPSAQTQAAPRILIENSEYWLSNIGDLAMMDVTIRRLRRRWPDSRIGILTDVPLLAHAYFPGVDAIDPRGGSAWASPGAVKKLSEKAG